MQFSCVWVWAAAPRDAAGVAAGSRRRIRTQSSSLCFPACVDPMNPGLPTGGSAWAHVHSVLLPILLPFLPGAATLNCNHSGGVRFLLGKCSCGALCHVSRPHERSSCSRSATLASTHLAGSSAQRSVKVDTAGLYTLARCMLT